MPSNAAEVSQLAVKHGLSFHRSAGLAGVAVVVLLALLIYCVAYVKAPPVRLPGEDAASYDARCAALANERGRRQFAWLFAGKDGRWSTSKTGFALWTLAVTWALVTILIDLGTKASILNDFPEQYLILLGIPAATAVAARGITGAHVSSGSIDKPMTDDPNANPIQGIGEVVSDDDGNLDLLDLQYFLFNLVLLAYFFTQFYGAQRPELPELPSALFAISGVSAAAYVTKKTQEGSRPKLTSVVPNVVKRGSSLKIFGSGLGRDTAPAAVEIVGVSGSLSASVQTDASGAQSVTLALPASTPVGDHQIWLTTEMGVRTEPISVKVVE